MRYFCRIEYEGTNYCGWQRQPDRMSIQQVVEEAAGCILRTPCSFTGAGRTDAGVHSRAMGAHFDFEGTIDTEKFSASMNAVLPRGVALYNVKIVPPMFHARFSALYRSYRYYICSRKMPLLAGRAWRLVYEIDWEKIIAQLPCLLGNHDFSAFCSSGSGSKDAFCMIKDTAIEKEGECMVFYIQANRFVYTMVRSLVGTLVDIGRGRQQRGLCEIIDRKDRSLAGMTAPAYGLILWDVVYAEVE